MAKWSIPGSSPISFKKINPLLLITFSNYLISGKAYYDVIIERPTSAHILAMGTINWGGIYAITISESETNFLSNSDYETSRKCPSHLYFLAANYLASFSSAEAIMI